MSVFDVRFLSAGRRLVAVAAIGGASARAEDSKAKNIIIMVPDGMGLSNVTATRIFKGGLDGPSLSWENLEHIGYQRTYSRNSTITDSAPAASAWSCGEKFNNGEICFHVEGLANPPSILELAQRKGKTTGLVATSTITHATPASFGAHVVNRNCENEIARQYIQVTGVDVLLGSGVSKFNSTVADACGTKGNFILEAQGKGYAVAYDKAGMDAAVAEHGHKVLGLFGNGGTVPEYLRTPATTEPHLAEMAAAALKVLEKNHRGFFLMVEGSQVDWANHANPSNQLGPVVAYDYQLGEMLAFDDAVRVVRKWIAADDDRRENTLLIVVADHDTGGFAINGPQTALLKAGQKVEPGWTTGNHTGQDTLIWSEGPGSKSLAKAIDNTEIYGVMIKALGESKGE
jgi:alkaline phosphatase